tara:strand:- start:951 stop:2201 length:1251 start_codon:yes stop_codon:yes gene_type:complete
MQFLWKYVDDLVGKGLDIFQIFQLMFFASARFVPLSLPLAILISSLMFYGSLGETNQINAFKNSGISFLRFSLPIFLFSILIALSSYLFSNHILPYANLKNASMIYSIQKKKPALNIREGIFYDEINGYKIKIGQKLSDNKSLENILIYTNNNSDNSTVIVAEKGTMTVDENKNLLELILINGYSYNELTLLNQKNNEHRKLKFEQNKLIIDLSSFNFMKNTESLYRGHYAMLNNNEILSAIDSLREVKESKIKKFRLDILQNFKPSHKKSDLEKIVNTNLNNKRLFNSAINKSQAILSNIQSINDELDFRNTIITKHRIEFLRKYSLAFACILMFVLGSSIGSLINKGGFGYPILASSLLFIIYYIISIIGEKSAKELTIDADFGMWLSNLIFIPISVLAFIAANNEIRLIRNVK